MLSSNRRSVTSRSTKRHVGDESQQPCFFPAADMICMPRLVRRDLPFHQSRNELNLLLKDLKKNAGGLRQEDWFHVALRQNTWKSVLWLLFAWTFAIVVFAAGYMGIDKAYSGTDCGLASNDRGVLNFGAYFAFSLETTTTVGYGLPGSTNSFFENCAAIQVMIYLQMVWSMMYNAFLFAFFFARLARTDLRGSQVVFSKTAILTRAPSEGSGGEGGPWMFQIRVCDVDATYPVVEAHIRLYAKVGPQLIEMRVLSPNDVLGANLFLSWPTTIKHEVDVHSPLHPPVADPYRLPNGGLNLRNAESVAGDVEQYACPVCAEQYGDMDRVRKHVAYYQLTEGNDNVPIAGSHRAINLDDLVPPPKPKVEAIRDWYPDEVIAVVEGIDSLMSGTFQAIQSYTLEDISWGGEFSECLKFNHSNTLVDLNQFHEVVYHAQESERESVCSSLGKGDTCNTCNPSRKPSPDANLRQSNRANPAFQTTCERPGNIQSSFDSGIEMTGDRSLRETLLASNSGNDVFGQAARKPPPSSKTATLPMHQGDVISNVGSIVESENKDRASIFRANMDSKSINSIAMPSMDHSPLNPNSGKSASSSMKKSTNSPHNPNRSFHGMRRNSSSSVAYVTEGQRGYMTSSSLRRRENSLGHSAVTPPQSPHGGTRGSVSGFFNPRPSKSSGNLADLERRSFSAVSSLIRRQNSGATPPVSPGHPKKRLANLK